MKLLLAAVLIVPLALRAAPAEKKLGIVAAAFAQIDDGPAAARDDPFVPGETLFFRCQVEGYKKSETNEIQLGYQVEAVDARGVMLLLPEKGLVKTTLSPEDKNWMPKIRDRKSTR